MHKPRTIIININRGFVVMDKLAIFFVLFAYVAGPIYIGWIVTIPKVSIPTGSPGINVFYIGVFIFFFGVGVLLRYHLGVK